MLSPDNMFKETTGPPTGSNGKTMSVGLVLSAPPSYSETFLRNKIRILKESGFDVKVFAERRGTSEPGVTRYGFNTSNGKIRTARSLVKAISRLAFSPLRTMRLFRLNSSAGFSTKMNIRSLLTSAHIIGSKLDWLHFGFATLSLERENVAKAINSKMAVSIRGFDIAIYPLKHPGCYANLWKRLDKLHYISDDLLEKAKQDGFKPSVASSKITPAIDVQKFSGKRKATRQSDAPLQILSVARLHWKKGFDYTLSALQILKKEGYSFRYQIIGDGPDFERLILARSQMGLVDEVEFLGVKTQDEIVEHLADSDVFVQYSIQEGFCNAVLEAQSMGVPCIVSDAEGLAENVEHGVSGWVVARRNPSLLASQLSSIMRMSDKNLARFSRAASERVVEHFSLPKQSQEFLEFYLNRPTEIPSVSEVVE